MIKIQKQQNSIVYTIVLLFFLIFNSILIILLPSRNPSLDLLMALNLLVQWFMLSYHLLVQKTSICMTSYLIFNYLFFFIAPLIQFNSIRVRGGGLPNTLPYEIEWILVGLGAVIVFNIAFFISYLFLDKWFPVQKDETPKEYNSRTFIFINLLSVLFLFLFYDRMIAAFLKERLNESLSIAESMLLVKVLYSLPLCSVMFFAFKYRGTKNLAYFSALTISLVLLLIYKNPIITKRNAIGPIYLSVLFFLYPFIFKNNLRSFVFLFTGLVIFFPLLTVFTHDHSGAGTLYILQNYTFNISQLYSVFEDLHYDAFSNLVASIKYIHEYGISYGNQLLGAFLFFVPRSIWASKPLNGGMEIGNYLMDQYSMWFNNLSLPFIAEGIMNFGYIGIFVFAFALAFLVKFIERVCYSKDILKKAIAVYFSFHLIFLLRGDLMNGIAYFAGIFVAIFVIPKFLFEFLKYKIRF